MPPSLLHPPPPAKPGTLHGQPPRHVQPSCNDKKQAIGDTSSMIPSSSLSSMDRLADPASNSSPPPPIATPSSSSAASSSPPRNLRPIPSPGMLEPSKCSRQPALAIMRPPSGQSRAASDSTASEMLLLPPRARPPSVPPLLTHQSKPRSAPQGPICSGKGSDALRGPRDPLLSLFALRVGLLPPRSLQTRSTKGLIVQA